MLSKLNADECMLKIALALKILLFAVFVAKTDVVKADPFQLTYAEAAPGVWVGVREDATRLPVVGNSVFVIGDEGVIVYDGGAMPRSSEQLLEMVESVTDLPVTHVVISHWHGDHNLGIGSLLAKYPSAQVIGHEFTRSAMLGSTMDYARNVERVEGYVPDVQEAVDTGIENGEPISETRRDWYREFLKVADIVDAEYRRSTIVPPSVTFKEQMVIHSGHRRIELLYLGDANTAGDIVMWLPEEKLVATGDIVVAPIPYAFNVPPRRWIDTLNNIKRLEFELLVPGHGAIQHNNDYIDLVIETSESIIQQRDALLAQGLSHEEAQEQLDYSPFRERYTGGDPLLNERFDSWFARPLSAAAFKALSGEPMVVVTPSTYSKENE